MQRTGQGRVTAECRSSDGACIASELFAAYPVRFHLTSRPNNCLHNADKINEEDSKWKHQKALTCYVLGYGGGMISGDRVELQFTVKENSSLLITSQSTNKAFKNVPGRPASAVHTTARVQSGGLLVLVPQPTQCFGHSNLEQTTNVVMDRCCGATDPSLLLVDWYTGGRSHLDGGIWNFTCFQSITTVSYSSLTNSDDEDLIFRDAAKLSGGNALKRHMREFNTVCMMLLVGPRVQEAADLLLSKFSSRNKYRHEVMSGTSHQNVGDGLNTDGLIVSCGTFGTVEHSREGVILRLAAQTVEQAARFLSEHIGNLSGQLEDDPFLEILVSKQTSLNTSTGDKEPAKPQPPFAPQEHLSFGLMEQSFHMHDNNSVADMIEEKSSKADDCTTQIAELKLTSPVERRQAIVNPFVLYQLVDSSAPTGGFSHSNTVEVTHQLKLIESSQYAFSDTLLQHVWDVMLQTMTSTAPFLIASHGLLSRAYAISSESIFDEWEHIDSSLAANITSHVTGRASALQGSGILRAFAHTFPSIAPTVKIIKRRVLRSSAKKMQQRGHAATCFGAVCGLLKVDEQSCLSMFLYTTCRDMINAAVRMNLVGPLEGGKMVNEVCTQLDTITNPDTQSHHSDFELSLHRRFCLESPLTAHQVAPLVEILANAHDRLYSRLFNS